MKSRFWNLLRSFRTTPIKRVELSDERKTVKRIVDRLLSEAKYESELWRRIT